MYPTFIDIIWGSGKSLDLESNLDSKSWIPYLNCVSMGM